MEINFFILCKKKYNNMCCYVENIINELDSIIDEAIIISNDNDIIDRINEIHFKTQMSSIINLKKTYVEEKEKISYLIKECDNNIINLCHHEFVDDSIDITPELSQNISYCSLCGYTK